MVDLQIRWAIADDAHGVAIVHVDAWRAAYRGLIDQDVLDGLSVDRRAEGWSRWIASSLSGQPTDGAESASHRLLVAESGNRIVGWAGFGAARDREMTHLGELGGLYVHPDLWSQRVGHALMVRVEEELLSEGWGEAYLWVLHGNNRAIRFYEQHGWIADGEEKVGEAGGARVLRELRHVRRLGDVSPRR